MEKTRYSQLNHQDLRESVDFTDDCSEDIRPTNGQLANSRSRQSRWLSGLLVTSLILYAVGSTVTSIVLYQKSQGSFTRSNQPYCKFPRDCTVPEARYLHWQTDIWL